ncbi:sigma-70 family RNA polymerase sigma factor [Roseateles asaccharophilus]|uniref:RNA polymerase sigma-70 factor (ECF subfamily) n=1 Tax=Roseateles asaccharophilus TaxID=582607 RepID=A0ABU2A7W1_9BURK|nr:sigma-70 family RNA polymerase sigma factor [Roseateles asaccharophilus]MDR7332683.1 RNA polymerase sigma-70 factor (ECF subfamily) [Roseateles asaccharophilus]
MSWLTRLGFVAPGAAARSDEGALLARVVAGDADALALIYRRESGSVYRYALALAGDEAAALDAVQEAFAKLLHGAQDYQPGRGSLGAYLAGMARHQLLNQWRDARRHVPLDDADDGESGESGSDLRLDTAQQQAQLWTAIRRLSWPQREAIVLVDLQERSYEDAAAIAGVSADVLRTRLHRARQRLADLLAVGERP